MRPSPRRRSPRRAACTAAKRPVGDAGHRRDRKVVRQCDEVRFACSERFICGEEWNSAATTRRLYRLCALVTRARIDGAFRGARSRASSKRTRVQERPKSIARVKARFAAAARRAASSASPRGQRKSAPSSAKSCDEAVREGDARHSGRRGGARRSARASRGRRARRAGDESIACASSNASRNPRLKPCPAIGCNDCAALPISTRARRPRRAARTRAPSGNVLRSRDTREAAHCARRSGARAAARNASSGMHRARERPRGVIVHTRP